MFAKTVDKIRWVRLSSYGFLSSSGSACFYQFGAVNREKFYFSSTIMGNIFLVLELFPFPFFDFFTPTTWPSFRVNHMGMWFAYMFPNKSESYTNGILQKRSSMFLLNGVYLYFSFVVADYKLLKALIWTCQNLASSFSDLARVEFQNLSCFDCGSLFFTHMALEHRTQT